MHIGGIEAEIREIRGLIDRKANKDDIYRLESDIKAQDRAIQDLKDLRSSIEHLTNRIIELEQRVTVVEDWQYHATFEKEHGQKKEGEPLSSPSDRS